MARYPHDGNTLDFSLPELDRPRREDNDPEGGRDLVWREDGAILVGYEPDDEGR